MPTDGATFGATSFSQMYAPPPGGASLPAVPWASLSSQPSCFQNATLAFQSCVSTKRWWILVTAISSLLAQRVILSSMTDLGLLSRESVARRTNREAFLLLGGTAALLLQIAHPLV